MKIGPIQASMSPHASLSGRTGEERRGNPAPEDDRPRGKIRHILHGWRLLEAPLVVQILSPGGGTAPAIPARQAAEAYRRRQNGPPPLRRLGEM